MIFVTGGCGFIGTRFVLDCLQRRGEELVNLDALTYAARPQTAPAGDEARRHPRCHFLHGNIGDRALVDSILARYQPRAIVHLAAETHVDRSIADATVFAQTNTIGTLVLLQATRAWLAGLAPEAAARFRFLHCSTDEVFGSLADAEAPCDENAPYRPRNPYSASKAAADHFVSAFHATHGLPVLITRAANTYGPGQYPEKLIPLAIEHLLAGEPVPLYGDGSAVRDWLYVDDHVAALHAVLENGRPGQSYNIAGGQAMSNRALVERLIGVFDREVSEPHAVAGTGREHPPMATAPSTLTAASQNTRIRYIADRPGHDLRYALDDRRLRAASGWAPATTLEQGLRQTVRARLAEIRTAGAA